VERAQPKNGMKLDVETVRAWSIPSGGKLVPLESADAVLLLSAASGLAGALVEANGLRLAVRIATAYLKMRPDEGICPISALSRVHTRSRSFEGVCLTSTLNIHVENHSLSVPVNLIRRVRICSRPRWIFRPAANIELVDGSTYKLAKLHDRRIDFLTVLGRQSVKLTTPHVIIRGHTVVELDELRHRLGVALERHRQAVVETVGVEIFEQFFRQTAA
jgi:hypothetical protein